MDPVLRPMSTSQVLDRTFHLYRNHFLLFCGIAAWPPAILMLMKVGYYATGQSHIVKAGSLSMGISAGFLGLLVFLACHVISNGATVYAVSLVHLGRPATIRDSYRKVKSYWGRLLLVMFLVMLRVVGIIFLTVLVVAIPVALTMGIGFASSPVARGLLVAAYMIVGFVVAIWVFARYALAVPACVLERVPARQALKRSKLLTKGSIGRILLVYILTLILSSVLTYLFLAPSIILTIANKGQQPLALLIWALVAEFLAAALAGPISTIPMALIYYDERVRKEAFDLQYMMDAIQGPQQAQATAAGTNIG